ARDILFFFPRDYQDLSEVTAITELKEGQATTISGVVDEIELRSTGPGRSMLGVLIRQENQFVRLVWFNQPYMQQRVSQGMRVLVSGTPTLNGFRWEMRHPRVEKIHQEEGAPAGRILPVYPLTEGVSQGQMQKIVHGVVEEYAKLVDEVFPADYLEQHHLWPIQAALAQLHQPENVESLERARYRFVYQELLVLQLALAIRRRRLTLSQLAPQLTATGKIDARIKRLFPFELTDDQKQAIEEIGNDLGRNFPMNRLLQGDVGTGKTVVAEYAMLLTVAHGYQAVLMAPTEILAQQHAETLQRDLAESRVRIAMLTGSQTAKQRRDVLTDAASGDVDLIIGTHALSNALTKEADLGGLTLPKLGLVIIDEQHKFGVQQRALLKQAGVDPHYLVMTATPIPRTVSMTMFGDLDVSTLKQGPPGRQPVNSYLVTDDKRENWWQFFCKKIREGRQGFVVAPLVQETGEEGVVSTDELFETLSNGPLEEFKVELLHGRLSAVEKNEIMKQFRRGKIQVLVATSVVEVGVDVPNATVMAIESAERFGLAQLHQLRGRICRGQHPGFLGLFSGEAGESTVERLAAFTATSDGFELAEIDFKIRGPGDLLGTRQHGLPPMRIADLTRDTEILETARHDAQQIIASDPELDAEEFERLKRMVMVRYGHALELGDVG
ncbi:MAG: ATP-dependent DNA helicase RecG, partial [Pirellulaceae bacterium]